MHVRAFGSVGWVGECGVTRRHLEHAGEGEGGGQPNERHAIRATVLPDAHALLRAGNHAARVLRVVSKEAVEREESDPLSDARGFAWRA